MPEFTVRRVVTGLDADGKSMIASDGPPERIRRTGEDGRRVAFDLWDTLSAPLAADGDIPEGAHAPSSTEIRIVNIPPGSLREMHRTDTVDYGIVLAGELYIVLETEETLLKTGDVVIQQGTYHAWHNRSDDFTRIAFINLKGQHSLEA